MRINTWWTGLCVPAVSTSCLGTASGRGHGAIAIGAPQHRSQAAAQPVWNVTDMRSPALDPFVRSNASSSRLASD